MVTNDALHCRGETVGVIKDGGGDWLVTLKADRLFSTPKSGPGSPIRPTGPTASIRPPTRYGRIEVWLHATGLAMLDIVETAVPREFLANKLRIWQ